MPMIPSPHKENRLQPLYYKQRKSPKASLKAFVVVVLVSSAGFWIVDHAANGHESNPKTYQEWSDRYDGDIMPLAEVVSHISTGYTALDAEVMRRGCKELGPALDKAEKVPAIPDAVMQAHWSKGLSLLRTAANTCATGLVHRDDGSNLDNLTTFGDSFQDATSEFSSISLLASTTSSGD